MRLAFFLVLAASACVGHDVLFRIAQLEEHIATGARRLMLIEDQLTWLVVKKNASASPAAAECCIESRLSSFAVYQDEDQVSASFHHPLPALAALQQLQGSAVCSSCLKRCRIKFEFGSHFVSQAEARVGTAFQTLPDALRELKSFRDFGACPV